MAKNKTKNKIESHERNEGIPFNTEFFDSIIVNRSAVERRVATLTGRRTVKKEYQAAWLLKAITMIDLTTLAGDDTQGNVMRLCNKAKNPVRLDILEKLGMADADITTGAVCVYHNLIPFAKEALKGSNLPIAAVSTGFPAGKISARQGHKHSKALRLPVTTFLQVRVLQICYAQNTLRPYYFQRRKDILYYQGNSPHFLMQLPTEQHQKTYGCKRIYQRLR